MDTEYDAMDMHPKVEVVVTVSARVPARFIKFMFDKAIEMCPDDGQLDFAVGGQRESLILRAPEPIKPEDYEALRRRWMEARDRHPATWDTVQQNRES